VPLEVFAIGFEKLVEPMGFESTSDMETKEFCGAPWPSKELKRKERNSYCPLIALRNLQ
jgi:hypothetical protein